MKDNLGLTAGQRLMMFLAPEDTMNRMEYERGLKSRKAMQDAVAQLIGHGETMQPAGVTPFGALRGAPGDVPRTMAMRPDPMAGVMAALNQADPMEALKLYQARQPKGPTRQVLKEGETITEMDDMGNVRELFSAPRKPEGTPSDVQSALFAAGGDEDRARQILSDKMTKPMMTLPGQEKAEAAEVGKAYGAMYSDFSKQAANAPANRTRIQRARQLNAAAGGGQFQPALTAAKSALVSLGVDAEAFAGLQDEEALRAITGDLALQQVDRTKGAVSNAEMDLFQQMSGNLSVTPQGREKIYDFMDRMEARKPQVYELARAYRAENGTLEGFETALNDWYEANPFFTQEEMQFAQPGQQSDPGPAQQDALPQWLKRTSDGRVVDDQGNEYEWRD